jgi:hypothetical protein
MRLNRRGANRWVLLVGFYAFKFPYPSTWRQVLFGILNNLNERDWSRTKPGTCPVLWSSPCGIVIVMPRVEILDEEQFLQFDSKAFCREHGLNAEHKPDSYGRLGDRIVAVDYGW